MEIRFGFLVDPGGVLGLVVSYQIGRIEERSILDKGNKHYQGWVSKKSYLHLRLDGDKGSYIRGSSSRVIDLRSRSCDSILRKSYQRIVLVTISKIRVTKAYLRKNREMRGSSNTFLFLFLTKTTTMVSQWLVKAEGKKVEITKPRLKISVPRFDNTELIARFDKTLIGRCMNPNKQDMKSLLFMLPRIWQVDGRVTGTDLGLGRFQFDFQVEEDILAVMRMEPFHFDYWMLSLVRWKPVLDVNYPSKITFWVKVLDVPLQYWAISTFQGIGEALGQVQGDVDTVEGRVRVEVDGFKPLIFSMEVDFAEGVELVVNLRYEKLSGFCRECCCMTHEKTKCPTLILEEVNTEPKDQIGKGKGLQPMSYRTVVAGKSEADGDHRVEFKGKEAHRGQTFSRGRAGGYRHDGSFNGIKEKNSTSFAVGSSRGGRRTGHDQKERVAVSTMGLQRLQTGEEGGHLSTPQRLMLEAFKGEKENPKDSRQEKGPMEVKGSQSKARKALNFEESETMEKSLPEEMEEAIKEKDTTMVDVGVGDADPITETTLEEANNELESGNAGDEGMLLSDSELLDEEWEEGEVPDFLEEIQETNAEGTQEDLANALVEVTKEMENTDGNVTKRRIIRSGVLQGSAKKRLVQTLLSPRKGKISKGPGNGKALQIGTGDGKKRKPRDDGA